MNKFLSILVILLVISCADKPLKEASVPISPMEKEVEIKKDYLNKAYALGQFDPASHKDFDKIPETWADRPGLYLRKEVLAAYKEMRVAAAKDDVHLIIRSATRNFDYQKGIWERKWSGATVLSDGTNAQKDINNDLDRALKILEYSSMPGSSRHHWGTDFDLNAFTNEWFESGKGLKIYNWLSKNASSYGFCQVYSAKGSDRKEGYNEEKWHFSYMPIAQLIQDYMQQKMVNQDIKGFKGDGVVDQVDIIGKYVLGISNKCQTK